MNDETPPGEHPPFWAMFVLGMGLFILSGILCAMAQSAAPLSIGALLALISVFFRGWRGIFAGYLTVIGILVLAVIVICGSSRSSF
jgi:hypothetical protein